ncbi:hypothetical protein NECID01_1543 [Nematocida sp. AWRm77]|nr:hypothetical protein NECID01_1543 [Nematocida sp. AWRm77]
MESQLLGRTMEEYIPLIRETEALQSTNEVEVYTKAYCLLVHAQAAQCKQAEEKLLRILLHIFDKRAGKGLFLSGELTELFCTALTTKTIDSEKEYFRAILKRDINETTDFPRQEKRPFRELEPKISSSHVRPERRSKEKPHRRQVRRERELARGMAQTQTRRKRQEDREYSSYIKTAEKKIKRQH